MKCLDDKCVAGTGNPCPWKEACLENLKHNCHDPNQVFRKLKEMLDLGPDRTRKVPFFAGPPRSGKSTLVSPLERIFYQHETVLTPRTTGSYSVAKFAEEGMKIQIQHSFLKHRTMPNVLEKESICKNEGLGPKWSKIEPS
jgi:hypothetical protein